MAHLTSAEIAAQHHVSVKTVHRLKNAGELVPVLKLPGKTGALLFDSEEAARVFAARAAAPPILAQPSGTPEPGS